MIVNPLATNSDSLVPFLKWAGGKRWLCDRFAEFFPTSFQFFIEPFLGSGAAFFHLRPQTAFLGDANGELVDAYLAIKEDWRKVQELLEQHQQNHGYRYYYKTRALAPVDLNLFHRAARFIYLNRSCWNGLYRVNLKGVFNVPKGTKSEIVLPSDDFARISALLQGADIRQCDFETLIAKAEEGDFVFVDPPYTVKHNYNGFVKYNENLFSWADQIRLRDALERAQRRGVQIMITNACHSSIKELYRNFGKTRTVRR